MLKIAGSPLFAFVALAAALAGCDIGSTIEAVNNTERDMLARISVTTCSGSVERAGYVVVVPSKTRLFIAEQPFTCPKVDEIEILATDCTPIAAFTGIGSGSVVIDDSSRGPYVQLQDGSKTGTVTAQRTDACPGLLPPLPASPGASAPSSF